MLVCANILKLVEILAHPTRAARVRRPVQVERDRECQ